MSNLSSLTTEIIAYESGELSENGMQELFNDLVKSGLAWKTTRILRKGCMEYMKAGYLSRNGKILKRL